MMGVSRSGFYKWKHHKPSSRDVNREEMIEHVRLIHEKHPTHGYRWTAAYMRINMNITISDNYAYKCYNYLGIKSETKHRVHYRPRKVRDRYPNLIYTSWDTVDRPRQVIVSDMTLFRTWIYDFEVTFYFDVFTKEILTYRIAERRGAREQYTEGLEDVVKLLKGSTEPTILHTDQGSVYASMAYNELIKDTNIIRSMSRAGKPTDNPVNEALNGWIKEELNIEYHIDRMKSKSEFEEALRQYVMYYNEKRPCYAIGYDTPGNYRKRFYKGELEQRKTFEDRILSTEPKFVQKKRNTLTSEALSENVSTFVNENDEKLT